MFLCICIYFTYTKTYVIIKMITLESSIYKVHVHDVSSVHVYSTTLLNVQWYSRASIGKYLSFRKEISLGILVLFYVTILSSLVRISWLEALKFCFIVRTCS